ncbi:MAG: aminotransferase class I/II-fold pyridoxal phosphate-dependent enzyme [Candidatus Dormibacteraeota bacterium]|nr:aminotransferase class I/II-fold pyridoxal phosphate-dependent enzyme [Candidatus Dormibacteraeota bacterium]
MPSVIPRIQAALKPTLDFLTEPEFERLLDDPAVANFALGNPQELPLPELVSALQEALEPRDKNWFAYKMNEGPSRRVIAKSISSRLGVAFAADDICVTNGGFGAIASTLRAVTGPGDEVIFISPPWFFYEPMIAAMGADPVRVKLQPPVFDLDTEAIAAAITPRTTAVLVNTPHNPTGRVYPPVQLRALASILSEASQRHGRTIYLLSDEPYHRIVFDDRSFTSPAAYYPATFVLYSYGKTLLSPGMRMGYIAMAPGMPGAEELRDALFLSQAITGWAFANADLQQALPRIEQLSIDIGALQRRRDRLIPALQAMGYQSELPEGTFYAMVKSPMADDMEFSRQLRRHRVLVLPGTVVEVPGWFRISLTANDEMVERGIPGFERALAEVSTRA